MVPLWTRARRLANVYIYAVIDLTFTLLWFAAFVAVAAWNDQGIRKGDKDDTSGTTRTGTCADFGYGSASKCETSKASVGFGVIIFLLFGLTSAISIRGVMEYRRTGIMPNGRSKIHGRAESLNTAEDPNKDPWSTNTDELEAHRPSSDPFSDPAVGSLQAYGQLPPEDRSEQSHGLLQHDQDGAEAMLTPYNTTATHDGVHPGRQVSFGSSDASELSVAPPPAYDPGVDAPSALSPTPFVQSPGGRVEFPHGRYSEAFS